jgi:putative SOS response-associated peptidase YedK
MCGRYVSVKSRADLIDEYNAARAEGPELRESYNVAPQTLIYAVLDRAEPEHLEHVERMIHSVKWGLVPGWSRDPKIGNKLVNARVETLASIVWGQPGESPIQPGCRFLAREGRPLAGRRARAEAVLVARGW